MMNCTKKRYLGCLEKLANASFFCKKGFFIAFLLFFAVFSHFHFKSIVFLSLSFLSKRRTVCSISFPTFFCFFSIFSSWSTFLLTFYFLVCIFFVFTVLFTLSAALSLFTPISSFQYVFLLFFSYTCLFSVLSPIFSLCFPPSSPCAFYSFFLFSPLSLFSSHTTHYPCLLFPFSAFLSFFVSYLCHSLKPIFYVSHLSQCFT